ncbi:hypothetical protein QCA50_003620 [Cerrena zonata]|uniref:Mitogen-activated protein kinase kinase kinase 1 n=1 Tax=Cerrena zonata TaxID=2478898 RepID=A0AAW0GWS2_9APHY
MPRGVKRPVDIVISSDDEDYTQSHWVPTPKAPYASYAGPSGSYHTGSNRDPIVIPDSPPPVHIDSRPRPSAARPPVARPPVTPQPAIPPPRIPSPVAPPPAKRQKKQKDPNGELSQAPEKRLAMFKKKCPQAIRERAERVATQRMYMIDRSRNGDELKETFSVLGSTGNVYSVKVDKLPSCNCPDALKGNHCKHILFIFLKVLQVTQASGYWYQKALLTAELEEVFANAPPAPGFAVNARVQEAYAKATGKRVASSSQGVKKRMPEKDTDCPVCYEGMFGAPEKTLVFCESCGNALHKDCFQQWAKATRGKANCVFCRAPWSSQPATPSAGSSRASGVATSEGYVNLAGIAGVSPVRDTSSYYQGPRKGKRHYGYQDYDPY